MKPWIHAESSAKRWGGEPAEYFEIHDLMDSSKGAFPTNAHRALTHNAWFIKEVLERIKFSNSCEPVGNSFPYIIISTGRKVSVRDIGEQHILEDFGNRFLPSAQDYLQHLAHQPWMSNAPGSMPASFTSTPPVPEPPKFIPFYDGAKAPKPKSKPNPLVVDGSRIPLKPRTLID